MCTYTHIGNCQELKKQSGTEAHSSQLSSSGAQVSRKFLCAHVCNWICIKCISLHVTSQLEQYAASKQSVRHTVCIYMHLHVKHHIGHTQVCIYISMQHQQLIYMCVCVHTYICTNMQACTHPLYMYTESQHLDPSTDPLEPSLLHTQEWHTYANITWSTHLLKCWFFYCSKNCVEFEHKHTHACMHFHHLDLLSHTCI